MIWAPGSAQVYYNGYGAGYINPYQSGYATGYINPYQGGYSAYGAGHINPYQSGYGTYGADNLGYPIYGRGPYVYGSPGLLRNSATGPFGAIRGATYGPNNLGLGYGSGAYYRGYAPGNARTYSPYGYRRY
jgi:hypothetical protein